MRCRYRSLQSDSSLRCCGFIKPLGSSPAVHAEFVEFELSTLDTRFGHEAAASQAPTNGCSWPTAAAGSSIREARCDAGPPAPRTALGTSTLRVGESESQADHAQMDRGSRWQAGQPPPCAINWLAASTTFGLRSRSGSANAGANAVSTRAHCCWRYRFASTHPA